ncbi:hypothetical protein IBT47_02255 [Erwinia sp. S43]|nr:hypothetical protein [Erwinia sp. S43]MBK0031094.1 hypothetical protein [Erwinia sp. S43]
MITRIPLDVRVMPGYLILTARESAREQRRVRAMIEVISRPQSKTSN